MFLLYSRLALARVLLDTVAHSSSPRGGDVSLMSPHALMGSLQPAKLVVTNLIGLFEFDLLPGRNSFRGSLPNGCVRSFQGDLGSVPFGMPG